MKNEAIDTFKEYLTGHFEVSHIESENEVRELFLMLQHGKLYFPDPPDMVVLSDDSLILIEHFEFDCYKRTKKGSLSRGELARIDREETKLVATEEGALYHGTIDKQNSLNDYNTNIKVVFEEHYKKIDSYLEIVNKMSVYKKSARIRVLFLIEDKSPLGVRTFFEDGMTPITLGKSCDFLNFFSKMSRVDYVIACSKFDYGRKLIWHISQKNIRRYIEQSIDFRECDYVRLTPNVISAKVLVDFSQE